MQLIESFFKFIGAVITSVLSIVAGVMKFTLGFFLIILILLVLVVFGLLHLAGAL